MRGNEIYSLSERIADAEFLRGKGGKVTILIASLLLVKQQWREERVQNERRKCEIQEYFTDSPVDSISLNTMFFG